MLGAYIYTVYIHMDIKIKRILFYFILNVYIYLFLISSKYETTMNTYVGGIKMIFK